MCLFSCKGMPTMFARNNAQSTFTLPKYVHVPISKNKWIFFVAHPQMKYKLYRDLHDIGVRKKNTTSIVLCFPFLPYMLKTFCRLPFKVPNAILKCQRCHYVYQ